jgi:phosphatidylglycerol---prolipoprotein diacylglyceryl transferase
MLSEPFIFDFNPVILSIGNLSIRWYSLFYILGILIFYFSLNYASKKKILNLKKNQIEDFLLYIMLGGILGGRIGFFLFYNPSTFINTPLEIIKIWHGGMSFHGGLIGVILSVILFAHKNKRNIIKYLDFISVIGIFSLMLGRIGNIINGELPGIKSYSDSWCFIFPLYDELCRHPYPFYALLSHLILFIYLAFILYLNRKNIKTFFGKGILATHFLIGYGVLRIITDIWKEDTYFLFLKQGQFLSLLMIIVGMVLLIYLDKKKK